MRSFAFLAALVVAGAAAAAPSTTQTIAFLRYGAGGDNVSRLYTMDDRGRGQRLIPIGAADSEVWSPDGRRLLFMRRDSGGYEHLRLWTFGAKTSTPLGPQSSGGLSDDSPRWSPDGRRVALLRIDLDSDTYGGPVGVIAIGAKRFTTIASDADNVSLAWSPRSDRLVLGRRGSVRLVAAADGPVTMLAAAPGSVDVDWSSTNVIAFIHNGTVESIRPDGSNRRTLATVPHAIAPSWSPDGRTLVFGTNNESGYNGPLYAVNADGTNLRKLTAATSQACCVTWSSDSTRLAYESDGKVWVKRRDGGAPLRLGSGNEPAWRPMPS
jgi:Tol biopolymer transport system component